MAVFEGKKDLFDGLWISSSDYEWTNRPVFHFDLSMSETETIDDLKELISFKIDEISKKYEITVDKTRSLKIQLQELIETVSTKLGNVVILVDEYDSPIHASLTNSEKLSEIQGFLRSFYSTFKTTDRHIHFCLITGITQFSKTSIFSGLNQLNDISFDESFSTLLGYTQNELESYFPVILNRIADKQIFSKKELLENIRYWYNGYQFTPQLKAKVYNPFSILNFFSNNGLFINYWFRSGNPKFLFTLFEKKNVSILQVETMTLNLSSYGADIADNPKLNSLLFQTGYLTISD